MHLAFGGSPGPSAKGAATEEFSAAGVTDTIKNEGQVYYNSTAGTMNITAVVYGTGAWASGGNMNTSRSILSAAGTQSATLAFGGNIPPETGSVNTETYNGSTWTEVNDMNTSRNGSFQAGTQATSISINRYYTRWSYS